MQAAQQKIIQAHCNQDGSGMGQVKVVTRHGIEVFGYDEILVNDLVEMTQKKSDPASYKNFVKFHNDNPWVLRMLLKMSKKLKRKGVNKYSVRGFFHIIRYRYMLKTKDATSDFGLSNNHSPYYARLVMKIEPKLEGFFTLRPISIDCLMPDLDDLKAEDSPF